MNLAQALTLYAKYGNVHTDVELLHDTQPTDAELARATTYMIGQALEAERIVREHFGMPPRE